jgi:hypothetical protein
MENSELTTFACLVERAARYPTITRRNQMHKEAYTASRTAVDTSSQGARLKGMV